MDRVLLVLALLAVAAVLGLWWRSRNGRFVMSATSTAPEAPVDVPDDARLTADELGAPLGARATFVQFSSEVCAPCRRTHAVLAQLASEHDDLSHV